MKKKEASKKSRQQSALREKDEFNSLNSSLGSFGLEPPKRYRQEQQLPAEKERKTHKRSNEKASAVPITKEQRQKAQNKKRKQNKLLRRILLYAALVIGILAVIVVLSLTVLFKINTIIIKGNEKYSKKEITAVLPIAANDNLFISDLDAAEEKLEENLPYIYDAAITRKFPSTIIVNITETSKVYCILNEDDTFTLFDDRFKVLELKAPKIPENAILIQWAEIAAAPPGKTLELTDEKMLENLKQLTDAVKRLQLEDITALYSLDINNNYMVYDKRITYKLGTLDNLDNKIYSALTATDRLNESNPQAEGTMTVTNDKQIYFTED